MPTRKFKFNTDESGNINNLVLPETKTEVQINYNKEDIPESVIVDGEERKVDNGSDNNSKESNDSE